MHILAQDAGRRVFCYANADARKQEQNDEILRFVKFWKKRTGRVPEELIFDSKLTTYANLHELNRQHIGFITLRRRSAKLLEQIENTPASAWRRVELGSVSRAYRTPRIIDQRIALDGYEGPLRQITIADLGHEEPTLLTNQLRRGAVDLIEHYARVGVFCRDERVAWTTFWSSLTSMPLFLNLWYLGTQFMASIQARDERAALRQLGVILKLVNEETEGHFSHYKLRTLQVLTNANRAAFNAGASTDLLHQQTREIVAEIDRVDSERMLVEFARNAVEKTVKLVPKRNDYQNRVVREAIAFISENHARAITRDEVAARLRCSISHFSRVFSLTTGYSFRNYLLQYRLEKAKELLQHSHLHVAEIANQVGYDDPFQFSKVFRKHVGISPRQFRRTNVNKVGPSVNVR